MADQTPGPRAVRAATGEPTAITGQEADDRSFEQLVGELEEITGQLSAGDLGIEQATDLYEKAEKLHSLATARLAAVRQRVDHLTGNEVPGAGS